MQIFSHIGVSLDGFVADANGLPAWDFAPGFGEGSHGVGPAQARSGAIVMGRTSFEQGIDDWLQGWPYTGKQLFVLTTRPLQAEVPSPVFAVPSAGELRDQLSASGIEGDAYVLGGGQTIRSLVDAGTIDLLGIVVLPVLLGSGIPLFDANPARFSQAAWKASDPTVAIPQRRLRLINQRPSTEGAVELEYALDA